MTASANDDLDRSRHYGLLGFQTTEDQDLVIRKAAELQGLTVPQYILCAVLDRAERDLYTAAAMPDWEEVYPTSAEPLTTMFGVFGDL
jgi:hypothetical protein